MALQVIATNLTDRAGTVTVQGDTQESVMSAAAKNLAISAATSGGVSRAGVSGTEVAYPVDAAGETGDDLILGRAGVVAAYRCDYKLTGGL